MIFFLPPLVPLYMYPSVYLLVGGWGLSPPPPPLRLTLGPPPIQTQHSRGSAPWPGHCPPKNIKKQPSMLYDKLQTRTTLDGTWIWKLAPAFMIWRWQKWVYNIFKSQIWSLGLFMLPHGHILHVTCTYTHVHVLYIVSHRNKSLYELVHVTYSVFIYNSRGDTIFTVNNTENVLHLVTW